MVVMSMAVRVWTDGQQMQFPNSVPLTTDYEVHVRVQLQEKPITLSVLLIIAVPKHK